MVVRVRVKMHRGDMKGIVRRVFLCPAMPDYRNSKDTPPHGSSGNSRTGG